MRIANVMRRLAFDEWGGTETAVWNSSLKLKEAGNFVEILATKALCGCEQEERDGLPVRRFNYFYPHLFLSSLKQMIYSLDDDHVRSMISLGLEHTEE